MLTLASQVSRREWAFVGAIVAAVMILTSWPTIVGFREAPAGTTYLGTNVPDVLDSQVYYAFLRANADGHTLYANQFTAEPQPAALFNPLWWLLGRVMALTGLSAVGVFWLARIIFGGLLIFGLYRILAVLFAEPFWRLLGLVLAVFGGGLGWAYLLGLTAHPGLIWAYQDPSIVASLPVDLTYSAGYLWMAMWHSPLYVFSLGLLLFIGWATWWSLYQWRWAHLAGVAALVLGLTHPYDLVLLAGIGLSLTILGIIGNLADQALIKKLLARFAIIALWALPAALYYAWLIIFVPAIREWDAQNVLYTSNLRTVIAGFSPIIFFVVVGIRRTWTSDRHWLWVPLAWLSAAGALLYVPLLQYQAKMIIGFSIPLAVVAVAGIRSMATHGWLQTRRGQILIGGSLLMMVLTPEFFFARVVQSQRDESQRYYIQNNLLEALRWIRTETPTTAIVLGDVWTGNLVPQYAGRATWLGHHHQTGNYAEKLATVRDWFFEDNDHQAEKITWLQREGIDYVVIGPNERRQGSFDPTMMPALKTVFVAGDVAVWAVTPTFGE